MPPRSPTTGPTNGALASCARAASGHASAALPSPARTLRLAIVTMVRLCAVRSGTVSEIRHRRLRDRHIVRVAEEGVRVLGADQLPERTFRRARQLGDALDRHLAHRRL